VQLDNNSSSGLFGINMKASEQAKQLGTTVTKMSEAWRCHPNNIRELYKNSPHKFKIIALGTNAVNEHKNNTN